MPYSSATTVLLMSSRVGPRPPVVSTAPVRDKASRTASRMASGVSPTLVRRATRTPMAASARAISAPLVSTVKPSSSSVPMVRSSRSIAGLPGAIGEQRPVAVEVDDERIDGEQGGNGQGDGHEAAMELIPVVRIPAVFPAEGLPGVAEREPEDDGADEDVLDGRLELARAARRDHDPAPAGP